MADRDSGADTRRRAAEAVAAVLDGASLTDALPAKLQGLSPRDRAFVQELAYGTVRWWLRFEFMLARLVEKPTRDKYVDALLGCGLHQATHMRVPAHAAVSATVAAAPKNLRGFCNAVLRNAARRAAELEAAVASDEVARSAHPRWLLDALQNDWPNDREAIVAADNGPAPMTLRVRGDRERMITRCAEVGIGARAGVHSPQAVLLDAAVPVDAIPGFAEGEVSVQDEAAQLAAGLVDARPGMRVLDACAAPGGKTAHLLERTPGLTLFAVDSDAARMRRVEENLSRLDLAARCIVADAGEPSAWWDGVQFDRILVDAPCSAVGVIRRHPDIRLLRRASDIPALAQRQRALLEGLWPLLRPGGRLVYATCSMLAAENDAVVGDFAGRTADAGIEPLTAAWGRATATGRQVLTGEDGMDGFHYACLFKEEG